MRNRFWMLLLATALVVAGAAWLATRDGDNSEARSDLWVPGLRGELDHITAVQLIGAGNKRLVTIERDAAGFVVVERDRYRADTATLRTLLLQLADARRVEAKTAKTERHAALGVESVASAKATGVRVQIEGSGKPVSLTVGRTADQLGGGTFVRTGDDNQTWLVSGNIVIEREPQRWLEKRIADIPAARIERIDVLADGERFALVRKQPEPKDETNPASGDNETASAAGVDAESADDTSADTFVVEGVAAADMASPYAAAATAGALGELDLFDVRPRKESPIPAGGTTELRFVLRNGVSVIATSWLHDGKTQLQLSAVSTSPGTPGAETVVALAPNPKAVAPKARSSGAPTAATSPRTASPSPTTVVATAVAAFNRQWQGWTYVLPPHRSAGMNPKRAAMLKSDDGS